MRPRSGRRRSATFPAGQAAVPARAYYYWGSSLERAQLPDTVTTIGASAFHGCTRLTSVSIPASVTSIGESAFACCTELTSVVLPDSVTTLGAGAFAGCSSLASVKLPRGLLVVNARAFACCTSLTSISLPETITTIGEGAFSACSSLTSAALPNSTRSLGTRAFARCSSLERVEMPAAIASIGASAFLGCSSLAHVRLPISVVTLGERAFDQCSSLAHVEVPVGARVGPNAFRGCLGHLQDGAAENMGETLPRAGWWPPSPRIARAPPSTPKLSSRRSQPECEVYVRGTYPSRHCGGAGSRPWHLSYRKRKLRFLGGTRTTYREVEIEGYERGSIVAAMVKSWKRYEIELELVNLGADGALRRLRLRCVSRDLFRVLLKLLSPLLAEPPGRAQARL